MVKQRKVTTTQYKVCKGRVGKEGVFYKIRSAFCFGGEKNQNCFLQQLSISAAVQVLTNFQGTMVLLLMCITYMSILKKLCKLLRFFASEHQLRLQRPLIQQLVVYNNCVILFLSVHVLQPVGSASRRSCPNTDTP